MIINKKDGDKDELYGTWYDCPHCNEWGIFQDTNFCPHCGGAIEWEEDEEEGCDHVWVCHKHKTTVTVGNKKVNTWGFTYQCSKCGEIKTLV